MGNWFEDRLAPSKVRNELHVRPRENDVVTSRLKRFKDATTQGTIADYGKNDFKTVSKESFKWETQQKSAAEPVQMIRLKTFSPEQSTRQVEGPLYGFGSVLPRHAPTYDDRGLTSTTHSAFGGPHALDENLRHVPGPINGEISAGLSSDLLEKREKAKQANLLSPDLYPATSLPGLGEGVAKNKPLRRHRPKRTGEQIWQEE